MHGEGLKRRLETAEAEGLKTAAEFALNGLARYKWGDFVIAAARGGERVESPRLHTMVTGIDFEGPVMVGAGWDKKGWAVDGLYKLGFSGTEVGSVLIFPQYGNPKPRLFTDDASHSVGLNRLGFNSVGVEAVASNLEGQERLGVLGISLGKNKLLADEYAPWAHAEVAKRLYKYADYLVINVSSPNTPGLRSLLNSGPIREIIQAVNEVRFDHELGAIPMYVKLTVDLPIGDVDDVLEVCVDEDVDGIIDTNTTIDKELKAKYGWAEQMGGLSGNDPEFRRRATERMKYITRATKGTGLQRIGVGGINNTDSAIERIEAGAQIVQVVTGIRQHKGRIAREINLGILEYLDKTGAKSVEDIVGIAA
ncbi:MAG TPA: dihydroorotate dehydrogenase (quinone) [Candidatus Saccharimonadales bacterium]|nr:dihydroorotate dehydrogenase (quinone) [Candidatus Saccharimonadales bacterium]